MAMMRPSPAIRRPSSSSAARETWPRASSSPRSTTCGGDGLLPDRFVVAGQGRRPMDDEIYRARLLEAASRFSRSGPPEPEIWNAFAERLHYLRGDSSDAEGFARLSEELPRLEEAHGTGGNRIFYLATQPSLFPEVIRRLGASGLTQGPGTCRIVIEKPFGRDLESARLAACHCQQRV